jgi:ethanolamine utilization protein EutN
MQNGRTPFCQPRRGRKTSSFIILHSTFAFMFLAKVEGQVVATKKDPNMSGRKLLLLRPQLVDEKDPTKFRPGANTIVAVDNLGAGEGELVLFCQGSSARLAPGMKDCPIDAVVIGLVDSVDVFGKEIFSAKNR